MREWADTRRRLARLAACKGVANVADAIPAAKVTVYRLIKGDTERPSHALRAAVERLIDKEKIDDPLDQLRHREDLDG